MPINQLKAGAFLSYVSIGLNNIVGLLYMPFMLRMMGQTEYGLYSLVASVIAYLTVLDLGFGNAIIRYTAKFRSEGKMKEQYEMFGMFLIIYFVIGILVFLIGLFLYFNVDSLFGATMTVDDLHKIRVMILLMTFNLAYTFPMSIWGAIISAYENFVFQKLVNIVRIVLNPIVMIIMLTMGYRAIGMVVVTTLFNIATLLINWWYCRNRLHIQVHFGKFKAAFLKEITIYSFWVFLGAIMDRIYWSTGQFVLGIYSGAAAIAVYAIAIQLHTLFSSFSCAISGIFLPKITAMITNNRSEEEISNLFIRTGRVQYIVIAFILTGFILFGRPFIHLWAGSKYDDSYFIALLFFIPLTAPLIQNVGISILQARNQMKFRSLLYVVIAIASLGISIPLTKNYGGIGCAIGTSIALIVGQNITMNIYYQKKMHINIGLFWKEISKMSIVPVLLGLLTFWVLGYFVLDTVSSLALSIVIFSIVYLPLYWFIGMNQFERNLFISPMKNLFLKLK